MVYHTVFYHLLFNKIAKRLLECILKTQRKVCSGILMNIEIQDMVTRFIWNLVTLSVLMETELFW